MKKSVIFVIAVLFAFSAIAGEMHFGAKAGLNLANLTSDNEDDDSAMKIGFNVGAMADIELVSMLSLQPEILFSMKGAKSDEEDNDAVVSLTYVEIPILAKVTPVKSDNMDLGFFAGPFIGFKMSENFTDANGDEIDMEDDAYKGLDMGLSIGACAFIPFISGKLGVEAGYSFGLTNIYDIPDDWPGFLDEPEAKTTNIFISAGFFFN